MLIFKCIIGFHSQIIDFTNEFAQAGIPNGEPVFIELSKDFKNYGGQGDVVLILNKILYGQSKATRLWYEKLLNGLLERGFVMSKVDPCLFMYNTVVCVIFVDDCLFWARPQSDIDNVTKSFKKNVPS